MFTPDLEQMRSLLDILGIGRGNYLLPVSTVNEVKLTQTSEVKRPK